MTPKKNFLQCVQLKGELSYLGKHAHFIEMGVTLCGCFTDDYNKDKFKGMPDGFTSEYERVDFDITCPRCIELLDMVNNISEAKKAKNN